MKSSDSRRDDSSFVHFWAAARARGVDSVVGQLVAERGDLCPTVLLNWSNHVGHVAHQKSASLSGTYYYERWNLDVALVLMICLINVIRYSKVGLDRASQGIHKQCVSGTSTPYGYNRQPQTFGQNM
jgi:hypothetical protein